MEETSTKEWELMSTRKRPLTLDEAYCILASGVRSVVWGEHGEEVHWYGKKGKLLAEAMFSIRPPTLTVYAVRETSFHGPDAQSLRCVKREVAKIA